MVAFGPAEAEALNLAARAALLGGKAGATGPRLRLGRREYATGEKVLALRRTGEVNSATRGTVVAVGPGRAHDRVGGGQWAAAVKGGG